MTTRTNAQAGYEIPVIALVDAHELWDGGYEGKIRIVDTTVTPPVARTLIQLAGGETLVLDANPVPSPN